MKLVQFSRLLQLDLNSKLFTDVTNAINRLKPGKSGGCSGLCSDYFKHAPRELAVYISRLLTALLIHSTMPREFLASNVYA